jgi:hypothetical protein
MDFDSNRNQKLPNTLLTEMSTEMNSVITATAISTNDELWALLMDVTNVREDSVKHMALTMYGAGLKSADDLDILSNLPKVVRTMVDCLKDVPAKKFQSEMKNRSVTSKAPFCPICRDAGLSAEEYTSHHIWSDDSRETVICPTLLAHTCEKCGETGHMPRYCGKIISKPKPVVPAPEPEKPKHCKVCYQAGFGPEVYSTHFTKVDDEILCPTILNNPCHRCGKKGHTPKYCTITVRSDRKPRREPSPPPRRREPSPPRRREPTPPRRQNKQQEFGDRYGDNRYEYDESGRPVAMKQFLPIGSENDYRRPQPMGQAQTCHMLKDVMGLLARAQQARSPEEVAYYVNEAMDMQAFLLKNI